MSKNLEMIDACHLIRTVSHLISLEEPLDYMQNGCQVLSQQPNTCFQQSKQVSSLLRILSPKSLQRLSDFERLCEVHSRDSKPLTVGKGSRKQPFKGTLWVQRTPKIEK